MSEYKVTIGGQEASFKWNMRAVKAAQEKLGMSFDKATEEDQWGAFAVAIFFGCNQVFTEEFIEENMTYETIGQVQAIFTQELGKFMEAAGMNKAQQRDEAKP